MSLYPKENYEVPVSRPSTGLPVASDGLLVWWGASPMSKPFTVFEVTLDMATPAAIDEVLARHPRVVMSDFLGGPLIYSATFTGPVGALVDLIRAEWEDGSGDDPGERFEFRPIG